MQQINSGPGLRWRCALRWQMGMSSVLGLLASVHDWLRSCRDKAESLASRCMPRHAYPVPFLLAAVSATAAACQWQEAAGMQLHALASSLETRISDSPSPPPAGGSWPILTTATR